MQLFLQLSKLQGTTSYFDENAGSVGVKSDTVLLSPFLNWLKLDFWPNGQSKMHCTLNFCPGQPGKNRMCNGKYWADLARPSAGIKNSLKNLCSHVIFIFFLYISNRNCWW